MKHEDNTSDQVMSVHIGTMGMNVTGQSLADLCEIKQQSAVYRHAIERIIRKLIDMGVCDEKPDKSEYIYYLRDLQDMKDHYDKIANLSLVKDGEEVEPVE